MIYKKASLFHLSFRVASKKKKILFFTSSALFLYACFIIYGSFLTNVFVTVSSSSLAYPNKNFQSNVEYQNFPANIPTFQNYFVANYDINKTVSTGFQNFRREIGETRFLSSDPTENSDTMYNKYLGKADYDNPNHSATTSNISEYVYPCLNYINSGVLHPLSGYDTFNPAEKLNSKDIKSSNIESHYPGFLLNADKNGTHSVYDDFVKSIVANESLSKYFADHSKASSNSNLLSKITTRLLNNIRYNTENNVAAQDRSKPDILNYFSKHGYSDFLQLPTDDGRFTNFSQYQQLKDNDKKALDYLQLAPDTDIAPFFTARCSLLLGILLGLNGNSSGLSFSNVFFQALTDYCRYFKLNSLISNNFAFDFSLPYEEDDSQGIPVVTKVFGGTKNNKILHGTSDIFEQGIIKNLPIYLLSQFYENKLSLNINLIPFNSKTDCKYTHIDGKITKKTKPLFSQDTELWGLPLIDHRVVLTDRHNKNLKPLIASKNKSVLPETVPVLINKTFQNKFHLKVGSIFNFYHEQEENNIIHWNDTNHQLKKNTYPASIKNFLSFNNQDTLMSKGGFKIGTNTNGLFYKFLKSTAVPNLSQFDSLSFLYKNYHNMESLTSDKDKLKFMEKVFPQKNSISNDMYGMNIVNKPMQQKMKIVGVINNNYYKPIMISNKSSTDLMNWTNAGGNVTDSGEMFNAKLTTKGSPDDLQNFSIYNKNSDYTPVGLNGSGIIWDPKRKKFEKGNILPFTFSKPGFGQNDDYYANIRTEYENKDFLANPKGSHSITSNYGESDEYAELTYLNNLEQNNQYKSFGDYEGNSTSSVVTMFSHDLFKNSIENSAKLISVMISVLLTILFLLIVLVLAVIFRNLVKNNKRMISILKAGGYNSFQIFRLIFLPFFISGFLAFCASYIVTAFTAKNIFKSLFTTMNVPPIFPSLSYAFGTTVLFFLFILGAILILLSFYNIRKTKAQL